MAKWTTGDSLIFRVDIPMSTGIGANIIAIAKMA